MASMGCFIYEVGDHGDKRLLMSPSILSLPNFEIEPSQPLKFSSVPDHPVSHTSQPPLKVSMAMRVLADGMEVEVWPKVEEWV